ncbi:hypothetical protein D3C75_893130 [compost metagenome]
MDQQREQEQQHPHGAGVEAVEQAKGEGEQRQAEALHAEGAEQPALDAGDCRLAVSEQGEQLCAAVLGVVEAHQHAVANHEGRYAWRPVAGLAGDTQQVGARSGIAVHRTQHDAQLRALGRQIGEPSLGGGAVRAAVADEDLEHRRRGWCWRGVYC